MKTLIISTDDALALAEKEEGQFYDRKALGITGRQLQKILVAYANSDGGDVVLGIADDKDEPDPNKRWKGVEVIEDFNPYIQALHELNPSPPVKIQFLVSDSFPGKVMKMSVDKGAALYKTADSKVYVRKGAQSLPVTDPEKIMSLSFSKGISSYEDSCLEQLRPELIVDSKEMSTFIQSSLPKTDPLDFVINQHLIDDQSLAPKAAAVLLFSDNPAGLLPRRCSVKIARYETKEDDPEREHLAENIAIEGPLYRLIRDAVDKVKEIMSSISIWTTEGMKKIEYPHEAIWEIIANAIIHRDYSISDDVLIKIFDNRIEVWSPGKLPVHVTLDNILDSRYSRNPKIVRTLHRYADPPNKDLGEGLNTAFQKMQDWKLQPPILEEESNYFKVTLPHTPLARPTELIMEFLENHDEITNRQARDLTGIKSENLVKLEFYKLRDEGFIEMVPWKKGPASAWHLTAKGKKHLKK